MNENIIPPTEEPESGEARGAEQQSLDDATYEPNAYVEASGDYRQAETIQAALTEVVQSASAGGEKTGATPLPIPRPEEQGLVSGQPGVRGDLDQAETGEANKGRDEATPINLPDMQETMADDKGATPLPIPRPEDQGLAESQSQVRGDLDQATAGSKGSGKDEATPINLPDMQETNDKGATPLPIPRPEDQGLAERQSQVRGDLDQATAGSKGGSKDEATPINLPGPQPANAGHPRDGAKISDGKSNKIFKDPLTDKGYGGEESSSGSESGADEPVLAEGSETGIDTQAPAEELTTSKIGNKTTNQDPEMASPYVIDGNEPETRIGDTDTNQGNNVDAGLQDQEGLSKNFDPERLGPGKLPEKGRLPVGMGPKGALFPGKGPGGKGPGGGSSSSGGGPPVNIPGGYAGSASKGKGNKGGNKGGGKSPGQQGRDAALKILKDVGIEPKPPQVDDPEDPPQDGKKGDPIDGNFGMPYTGNWSSGEKPDPNEPVGGLDREAGKVFPVYGKGGGGESGGKTPGDKDGDDDSGKFLGDPDLTGGPDLGDPDFPDYYTPNALNEVEKAKKVSK